MHQFYRDAHQLGAHHVRPEDPDPINWITAHKHSHDLPLICSHECVVTSPIFFPRVIRLKEINVLELFPKLVYLYNRSVNCQGRVWLNFANSRIACDLYLQNFPTTNNQHHKARNAGRKCAVRIHITTKIDDKKNKNEIKISTSKAPAL